MFSPSSYATHTVSLPAFFADGFKLAASPLSLFSPLSPTSKVTCEVSNTDARLTARVAGCVQEPFVHISGSKRQRSLSTGTSTHGVTPGSECKKRDSVDFTYLTEAEKSEAAFSPVYDDKELFFVAPNATSLSRITSPSGLWQSTFASCSSFCALKTADTATTLDEKYGNNNIINNLVSSDCDDCVDGNRTKEETPPAAEFVSLIYTAIQKCYNTEDEQLWSCRDEEASVYMQPKAQEELEKTTSHHCLSSTCSSFERVTNQIRAQKRRRLQQSVQMENRTREIARAKELPMLIEDAVRYAQLLVAWKYNKSLATNDNGAVSTKLCDTEEGLLRCNECTLGNNRTSLSATSTFLGFSGSSNSEPGSMLYSKFPPPLFRTSSFASAVCRLLRWVRTWQVASPDVVSGTNSDSNGVEEIKRNKKQPSKGKNGLRTNKRRKGAVVSLESCGPHTEKKDNNTETSGKESHNGFGSTNATRNGKHGLYMQRGTAIQQYHDDWIRISDKTLGSNGAQFTPTQFPSSFYFSLSSRNHAQHTTATDETQYGLSRDHHHAMYDEYGNCLRSVRLARKMAEQRAIQEEAQKMRERRRGYFARAERDNHLLIKTLFDDDADFGASEDRSNDSDDCDDVTNIAILYGPSGVGKTAIVYLVAEILGYRVVEMNTSVRRCPKNIDRLLSEVTRSCRLSSLASGKAIVSIEEELKRLKDKSVSLETAVSSKNNGTVRKKSKCVSAEALAAFFWPRDKTKKLNDPILVDDASLPAGEVAVVYNQHAVASDISSGAAKKNNKDDDAQAHVAPEATSFLENARTTTTTTAATMSSKNHEDATRTLILFEDADVMLGDEAMKPFYSAVRDLAQRSKVPIIVTVSSKSITANNHTAAEAVSQDWDAVNVVSMDATQAAQFFGKRTPFTYVEPMSRSALFTQLIVVAAVERGLVSIETNKKNVNKYKVDGVYHTAHRAMNKENDDDDDMSGGKCDAMTAPTSLTSLQELIIVNDVVAFQQLVDAVRSEVYTGVGSSQSGTLDGSVDMRWWLNRLQYLLLEERWPELKTEKERETEMVPNSNHNDVSNIIQGGGIQSYWDTQLGRVLRASTCIAETAYSHLWEWKRFQYAEEVASIVCQNDVFGCGYAAITGEGSSGVEPLITPPSVSPAPVRFIDALCGALPSDFFDQRKLTAAFNGAYCSTTNERIDAFSGWWRRTRKSDAIKLFVAARGAGAYEDVIGFSCLLQQQSGAAKANTC